MLAYLLNYLSIYLPRDEEGQGMAEYGLILGLLAVGVIAVLAVLGPQITEQFQLVSDALPAAGG